MLILNISVSSSLVLHIKSYEPTYQKLRTTRFSALEIPTVQISSSYLRICGILYVLPEERSRMRVYFFFFFQGWSSRPSGSKILREGSFELKLEILVLFLSDQKIGG